MVQLYVSHNGCRPSSTILELDCRQSIPSQNSLEQPEKDGQTTVNCNFDEEDVEWGTCMSTHIWVERSRSGGSIDILVEYLWCRLLCRIRKFAVAHAVKTRFLSPWKSILYCKFQSGNYRNSVEVLRIQRILRWYQWRWSVMFFDLQSYSISDFFRSAFKIPFTVSFPNMRKKSSSQIPRRKISWENVLRFSRLTTRTVSDFSTRTVRHQNAERERFSSMCGSIWYSALVRPRYGGENDQEKINRVQGS